MPLRRLSAQKKIARSEADIRAGTAADSTTSRLLIHPTTGVWLAKLDDDNTHPTDFDYLLRDDFPLNTGLFLDLPHCLRSLSAPQKLFSIHSTTAWHLARAQNVIDQMLKH